jgi:ABC-2 type transport system permease protein
MGTESSFSPCGRMQLTEMQVRFERLEREPLRLVGNQRVGVRGTIDQVIEIFRHREMLGLLVRRDLKSRYKDSALGFIWTLIRPVTQLLIYYVALGKFLGAERGVPNFAIYIFAGLTIWGLLSEIISGGTGSVVGNAGLLKKVYLPREVFPIASVGGALFNFVIQMLVLLAAALLTESSALSWNLLYAFPSIALVVVFGTALALLLSAANVYLRDVQYLVEVGLLIFFWASPIVYPWKTVAKALGHGPLLDLYTDNPVTLAVLGFQRAFWQSSAGTVTGPADLLTRIGIGIGVGVVLVVVFQTVFSRLQGNFAQAL